VSRAVQRIRRSESFSEAAKLRRFETRDIARRLGAIPPNSLVFEDYLVSTPITAFNPSLLINGGVVEVLARVIMGYYKYVSAIASFRLPLEDVLSGGLEKGRYPARLIILPGSKYDFWGAEDPRATLLSGRPIVTYTGRTISYFIGGRPPRGVLRDIPVTAIRHNEGWDKRLVHIPPEPIREEVDSDKNAFIVGVDGALYFFHRPTLITEEKLLLVSKLEVNPLEVQGAGIVEVQALDPTWLMPEAPFEEKIGWGPAPIRLRGRDYLFILHGVDRELTVYRVFSAIVELNPKEPPVVKAVTPTYIMEPREIYEVFGDRPYTIYPCGLGLVDRENLLLSYGASDYSAAFALINLDELLGELDKGRIY